MTRERIEDFREIVLPFLSRTLLKTNYENMGKSDAEEFEKDFNEILDLAIKTLKQEPKWIPVSERLPEVVGERDIIRCSEDVLVYDGADLRVGYFVRIEKFDRGYWNIYGDDCFEPIAWTQLTQPYKAESEDKG